MLPLRAVSMAIMGIALLAMLTSLSTDEWFHVKTTSFKKFSGLWNHCVKYNGSAATCVFLRGYDAIPMSTMTSIRGFFALALLFLLGAIVYPPFYKQMTSGVVKLEFMAILCLISTAFSFLGMIIMTHEVHSKVLNSKFGYSYYLGWGATGVAAIAAAIGALSTRDDVYMES